jgi:hydrogenase nickel incorporation protein HypA/HybF
MHEWALAEGIVKTADKFAEDQGIEEITEVKIMIGELQQVEHEIIEFALDQLRTPRMKSAEFTIETAPARFKCRKCTHEWQLKRSTSYLRWHTSISPALTAEAPISR